MIGQMYGDWIWAAAPLQVNHPSAWIWAGTGATQLTTVAGLYQNESDQRFGNGAEPAGVETVAGGLVQSYFGGFDQAETTLYTAPSGAQVFAAGSIGFSRVLAGPGRWDPVVQQLVANLFSTFAGDGTLPAEVKSLNIPSGAPAPSYRAGVQVSTVTRALTQPSAVAVAPDGTVVVAGAADAGNLDGPAAQARFNSPRGVAVAPSGAIYVSDTKNNRIRIIQNGAVSGVAGGLAGPDAQGFADGQGTAARFAQPMGIALQANGNLLVADSWNLRIREVTPQGAVNTWVGSGSIGVDNGAGAAATLQFPMAIAVTPSGDALFVEPDVGLVRSATGAKPHATSQFAGQLFVEGWRDASVSDATMYHTVALAVRPSDGQVLLVDGASARVRAIRNGTVDTLAGGLRGGTVDGSGEQAGFSSPRGVAIAPDGSAYVVDTKEQALRRITGF
jgi:hypothetical protein